MMKRSAGWFVCVAALAGCGGRAAPVATVEARDTQPLAANRDRLFADLAARLGANTCDLWSRMVDSERYTFLVQTLMLGSWQSFLYAPTRHYVLTNFDCDNSGSDDCDDGCNFPHDGHCVFDSGSTCAYFGNCGVYTTQDNDETLLDHVSALYSVNGPGDGCGGADYNRIWVGFDAAGTSAVRNWTLAGGKWQSSNDPEGAHDPFNAREDISWDTCYLVNNGPTRHHWNNDSDMRSLSGRLGVQNVQDASITEITTSYSCFHDANPTCDYSGGKGFEIAQNRIGPGFYDWTPAGCAPTPPAATLTYASMGPGRALDFVKHGDNGTASCDDFCRGTEWGRSGACSHASAASVPCDHATGDLSAQLTCQCRDPATGEVFEKDGDNGTASCDDYCAGADWGRTGSCVGASVDWAPCSVTPGYIAGEWTCSCSG